MDLPIRDAAAADQHSMDGVAQVARIGGHRANGSDDPSLKVPASRSNTPSEPLKQARVELPTWLWGGSPAQLLKECRYKARSDGGAHLVQPEERYLHRSPDLVKTKTVYGPGVRPRLSDLANLRERIEPSLPKVVGPMLHKRRVRAETTRDLLDLLNYEHLSLYAAPVSDLPDRATELLEILRGMPFDDNPKEHPFEGAALDVVEIDKALVHRLKLASVWLRIEQDERLGKGDVSHLNDSDAQGHAFGSSSGLYSGVFLLDAYIDPLLAALAPAVWGFSVIRSFGHLIFSFGRSVPGSRGDAAELLQLISVPGASEAMPMVPLREGAASDAIGWWVGRLNQLFGVLSDLATFTDSAGLYRAEKHLEGLLTVEQIFRRTTSMQLAHRDSNARRTLLFSVLDSIQRVNGWNFERMCTLTHAEKVLSDLEATIPDNAGDILLPMARRAVDSLRRMQEGFFIRRHLRTMAVELHLADGSTSVRTTEEATALYLKVLRDATHGHGGKGQAVNQTAALLAHHDGEVPHDIGLLAYLYLLDMVANPDRVRRCLYRSGR